MLTFNSVRFQLVFLAQRVILIMSCCREDSGCLLSCVASHQHLDSLELGLHKPDEAKGKKEKKKKEFGTTFHSGSANIIKRTGRLGVEGTGLPCACSLLWQGETFSGSICT